tara:strand:+ start:208 stop:531 length:324 start_codon:yes stop_codon:yes gene_type:complete
LTATSLCLLIGCQSNERENRKKVTSQENYPYFEYEINKLKLKVSEIEEKIQSQPIKGNVTKGKSESNQIKSITFRIGSEDDRIRIYWNDGSKTDLPCTKEQSIWACG